MKEMKELYIKTLNTMVEAQKKNPEMLNGSLLTMGYLAAISETAGKLTFYEYLELKDMIEDLLEKYVGGIYDCRTGSNTGNRH